jgi:hypothetical protein
MGMGRSAAALFVLVIAACARGGPPLVPTVEVPVGAVAPSQQIETDPTPIARRPTRDEGTPVEVEWHGRWWPAVLLEQRGDRWLIHYVGYGDDWDEVVTPDRIREPQTVEEDEFLDGPDDP